MELRVLRYFLAVAREESISRAAESLHLTQPTLSRQIMDLEEELGIKLLNRGKKNRKVTLTDEGKLFRKRAEELVELADKMRSEFSVTEGPVSGDIYIGSGETEAMCLIAKAATELQKEYPHIRYHLFSGNAADVTERLDNGLLDFGILVGEADLTMYDHLPLPVTDVWGVLMRKDSPLAEKSSVSRKDLSAIPLILSQQSLSSNELSGWYGGAFEESNVVATYNLIYNAALMVASGFGYAVTLDKLVNGNSELCFRPLAPKLEARLSIVWKKHHGFSRATELFLQKLRCLIHPDDQQSETVGEITFSDCFLGINGELLT